MIRPLDEDCVAPAQLGDSSSTLRLAIEINGLYPPPLYFATNLLSHQKEEILTYCNGSTFLNDH